MLVAVLTLWLAGRYHHEVYAINTRNGELRARIKTGRGPHGLCIYPQPGRYSRVVLMTCPLGASKTILKSSTRMIA